MKISDLIRGPVTGRILRCAEGAGADSKSTVTRREFLTSSLLTTSVLPISHPGVLAATLDAPEFDSSPSRFSVRLGEQRWVLDCKALDGPAVLETKSTGNGCYAGSLRDAFFANTTVSADLDFRVDRVQPRKWWFSLSIPSLAINGQSDLAQWLCGGRLQADASARLSMSAGKQFCLVGSEGNQTLDALWRLDFPPRTDLRIGERFYRCDELSMCLCSNDRKATNVRTEINARYARSTSEVEWLRSLSTVEAITKPSTPLRVRCQLFGPDQSSLSVEPESELEPIEIRVDIQAGGRGHLLVQNFRFIEEADKKGVVRALAGDIASVGSYLVAGKLCFNLQGANSTGHFFAESLDGQLADLQCAPSAVSAAVPVRGAWTSPFQLSHQQVIRFIGPNQRASEPLQMAQAKGGPVTLSDHLSMGSTTEQSSNVTGHVVCKDCASDGKPHNLRYFSTHVIRAEDLLSLGFEFFNFELESDRKVDFLTPLQVPGPSLVIVHFPPQHILEHAYNEDLGCSPQPAKIEFPHGAKLSGPSRLVFEFPKHLDRLDLTVDALTDWRLWKIRKVPDKRHARLIRPPSWHETALEVPSRLLSQPANGTHWRSKKFEGREAGRYAVFHTELVPDASYDPAEPSGQKRPRFVPIWTPDFLEKGVEVPGKPLSPGEWLRLRSRSIGLELLTKLRGPGSTQCKPYAPPEKLVEGQSDPLSESERREIVRLSHDATACATPPAAKYFVLTTRGAFADVEGYWPQTRARSCANFSLEKWNQIFAEGQDQKITIEKRGFIYPFGHRVVYVKDTKRKLHHQDGAFYAVLKSTYYIVIRQPTVAYGRARVASQAEDRSYQLPFRVLSISEKTSPNLDPPELIDTIKTKTCLDSFWPTRCGELLELSFQGVDWVGNECRFKAPVLFVQDTVLPRDVSSLNDEYLSSSKELVRNAGPRRVDLAGQLLALASSFQKGDTEVDALRIDFAAFSQELKYGDPCPKEGDVLTDEQLCEIFDYAETEPSAPFYPIAAAVESRLPSLGRVSSSGGGEMWLAIANPERAGDRLEIFAIKHPDKDRYGVGSYELRFDKESERSGGVAAPTPDINALSRLKGPVGLGSEGLAARFNVPSEAESLATMGAGAFLSPETFFSKLDAKILGVLPIRQLLSELGIDLTTPSLLSFLTIGGDIPSSTGYIYDWDTDKLKSWPEGEFGFQFKNTLEDDSDIKSRLSLRAGAEIALIDGAEPVGFVGGSLTNFRLRLVFLGNGIEAPFYAVRFRASLGEKVSFDVDLGQPKFVGPMMEFAGALKEYLGLGDGYDIDVRFDSLTASIGPVILPPIGFGVFSLSNVGFFARCSLQFRGQRPLAFGFGFASRDAPFTLAVAFLAGRGHFLFDVDTSGIQRIEGALEFGAYAELAFGSVAHGYLYVMGGVFYSSTKALVPKERLPVDSNADVYETQISLEIYIRLGGGLKALGFISISVDVHLGLSVTKRGGQTFAEGRATCTYCVKVGFFRKSFSVTYSRSFAGSASDADQQALSFTAQTVAGDCASPASCADAIGRHGFREYWYAFQGGLGR